VDDDGGVGGLNVAMKRAVVVVVAVAVLAAACARFGRVGPGRVDIAGAYTVDSPVAWDRSTEGKSEMWTVDGLDLQRLTFVNGLADGDALFEAEGDNAENPPRFHSNMSPVEIKELIEAGFRASGAHQLETYDFRPEMFGSLPGYRFEFSYTLASGLENEGTVIGANKDGKLYLIVYTGTRFYYYGKHKDDVERLIDSIRIL
jgi:hypothetical protein